MVPSFQLPTRGSQVNLRHCIDQIVAALVVSEADVRWSIGWLYVPATQIGMRKSHIALLR